jgi:hypothetical protein
MSVHEHIPRTPPSQEVHINSNSNVSLKFNNIHRLQFMDSRGANKIGGYNVTLADSANRDGNSGTWKILKVQDNSPNLPTLRRDCPTDLTIPRINSCLQYGDRVELINMYNQYNGFLHYDNSKEHLTTLQHPFYNRENNNGWQLARVNGEGLVYGGYVKSGDNICLVCDRGYEKHVVVASDKKLEGFPVLKLVKMTDHNEPVSAGILVIVKKPVQPVPRRRRQPVQPVQLVNNAHPAYQEPLQEHLSLRWEQHLSLRWEQGTGPIHGASNPSLPV